MKRKSMYPLKGVIQHYNWGGTAYLPQLLGIENPNHEPYAEYWLGAHAKSPSEVMISEEKTIPLNTMIAESPETLLGKKVAATFEQLPFLLKILDVKDMLSIQVHPSKKYAQSAYKLENEAGIPLDAPHRNYKDDNHKPELMVALSEFWLLHGFKQEKNLLDTLFKVPELKSLVKVYQKGGYEGLYRHVMEMPQASVNEMLQPLLQRIIPAYHQQQLQKDDPSFWAARAALTFNVTPDIDRGIFSIYFFNLVHLQPGQAIYQAAGILHAYLEGQNVEIMANSDNVLRGGLTTKHVDVPELMKSVKFSGIKPAVIKSSNKDVLVTYTSAAKDFELSKLNLEKGAQHHHDSHTTEIVLVLEGAIRIKEASQSMELKAGDAAVLFDGASPNIKSLEKSTCYLASVPFHNGE